MQTPQLKQQWVAAGRAGGVLAAMVCACLRLQAQSVPDVVWTTNAHSDSVRSLAIATNSLLLVSGSEDRTAKAWSLSDGVLLQTFGTPNEWVISVAASPAGDLVGTGGDEGKTRVWRVADGARLWASGNDNDLVWSLAFSPDGSLLAIGGSWGLSVGYALPGGGIPFGEPERQQVFGVAFSPDGQYLASANEGSSYEDTNDVVIRTAEASLWRVPEGDLVRNFVGHSNAVKSVDFSPDGSLLATASADGTARLWRVADGTEVRVFVGGGDSSAKFSADAQLLLTLNAGAIRVWRVADGRLLHTYENADASCLAVAANGKYFAYGRPDGAVVLARMPLVIMQFSHADGQLSLTWQGGSGLYQLQRSTNAWSGWQDVGGPTTNKTASVPVSATVFYRVQSLPNP